MSVVGRQEHFGRRCLFRLGVFKCGVFHEVFSAGGVQFPHWSSRASFRQNADVAFGLYGDSGSRFNRGATAVDEHERGQLAFLLTRYCRHVTTLLLSLGIAKDTNSGFKIFEDILNLLCSMVRFQKIEYDAQNTEADSDDHSD
jgi:hypothetical protein